MDELDELIEEFEWRASMEGELANSAFAKESFDSFERYKCNKIKYNRVAELLKELKEYKSKDGKPKSDCIHIRGSWLNDGMRLYCSNCRSGNNGYRSFPFCPYCGADMRESQVRDRK